MTKYQKVSRYLYRDESGVLYFRRRVPLDYRSIDPRSYVRKTTRCRDVRAGMAVAERMNAELERFWAAGGHQNTGDGETDLGRHDAALKRARVLGVSYKPIEDVASGSLSDIVRRIEVLESRGLGKSREAVVAALGSDCGEGVPLSRLLKWHEQDAGDVTAAKSPDELRKWRNTRKRALNNLMTVVGDKAMSEVTRHDALEFRRWWLDRIAAEQLTKSAANKEISTLNALWTALIERHMLEIDNPFSRMRLRGEQSGRRQAFDPEFVETRILAPGALDSLNRQARAIIYLVAALGVRPKEAATARPSDVYLEADIPYWHVSPGATGKTASAERTLPLHGLALEVWRAFPDGFPRYSGTPDSFSAIANKALLEQRLRPTENHTVYSLRHTFQDLLTNAEVPERIDRDLFGHTLNRIEYGAGADLKTKLKWLKKVAYKVKPGLVS